MYSPAAPSRSADIPGRTLAFLTALAAALVPLFVLAPGRLAAGGPDGDFVARHQLGGAFRESFVAYWSSGHRDLSPGVRSVVDYWFRYHLAKAAIAAILLIVLVALGVPLWRAFLRAGGSTARGRAALASAATLVTALALFALVVVMANIQGATAPFTSLFPMLMGGTADGELSSTLAQVRQGLADSPTGGHTPPALGLMISDYSLYHVAMAVIATTVAALLIGMSALLWKRFAATAPSDGRTRRVLGAFGALTALLSLALIVVAVANTTNAADPAPGLLALFEGGW
ncbi:hypothetical protein [Streptomyces corynorhini]|uniref:hypothetical protein n=1 Tax=Streptomyces corynorhini TaxID=2282652 RepID=UPI001F2D9EAB|nr:hypothetical protein [Streptomyces corynorhini]